MNYLPMLTEDEIRYVCSVIPLKESVDYFKHYPKDFNKVIRGYRPTSLHDQEQISAVLFRTRKQPFISSFIEKHISRWLDEIEKEIKEKTDEGEGEESALLQTLPHCFFVDKIELYFKLTGTEHSAEFLSLFSESIKVIEEIDKEREQSTAKLEAKIIAVNRLESDLEHIRNEQTKTNKRLSEYVNEVKVLKRANVDLEKSISVTGSLEQIITSLKDKAQEREDYIKQLKTDLIVAKEEQLQLKKINKEVLARRQEIESQRQESAKLPRRPRDLEEFKEYLGYNFESIGVQATEDYYPLLKDHICNILFQGKPILISRSAGATLMKCISNALVKTPQVPTLAFSADVTETTIDYFLSRKNRVLCLDNFIGNFNETTLITICERHRDKIIFLAVSYDRTLAYVADEFRKYCHYLNLNRIEAFSEVCLLTEDPSVVDEIAMSVSRVNSDARWATTLKGILDEIGVRGTMLTYKSTTVTSELCLCQMLAFDILPYCADVLKIAPFNSSELLLKYAGANGRCQYKALLGRWFS